MNFRPNPNFIRELKVEPDMSAELHRQAKDVRREAKIAAPEKTGYYVRRIGVAKDIVSWRVESTDPFGHLVEWGSVNNIAYAPLRRGVRAAGLRFVPDPKKTL